MVSSIEEQIKQRTTQENVFAGDYRFPSDIDSIDHWMQISIFQYAMENIKASSTQIPIGSITLPIPSNLQTSYSQNYENINQNVEGTLLGNATTLAKQVHDGTISLADLSERAKSYDTAKFAMGILARTALSVPGGQSVELALGVARNPHKAITYNGPNFRCWCFKYNFTPRNKNETEELQKIIKFLKYSSAPRLRKDFANQLFDYPEECSISFHYPDYLFSIGTSVITNVSVSYDGETGIPAFFSQNKAPVNVGLVLEIAEATIVTKDEIQQNNR